MMCYQKSSFLCPADKDYSHKTLLNTENNALGNAKDRAACGGMARRGAGHGPYAALASYADASAATHQQRVSLNGLGVALGYYKKRSCSRYYLKSCKDKRLLKKSQTMHGVLP
jgi:hypothetical protein